MTFQQLQYLLEVEHTGSFSQAAKNLFVTQSTVSNAVSALETELNCRIFIRSTHGLTPTAEGQQVLAYAQRICENHDLLTSSTLPTKPRLRVSSSEYPPARNAFLRIVEEYRDQPDVEFSFGIEGNSDFYDNLLLHQLDISISISYSPYDRDFNSIAKRKKLLCQNIVTLLTAICIGPGHRLYHKKDLKPADFAQERLMDHPGTPVANTGAVLAYVPINKDTILVCNNTRLRQDVLKSGLAYTVGRLPSQAEQEETDFRYIPIPGLTLTVAVYTDPIRPVTPLMSRYLELLQEEIRKEL